MTSVPSSEGFMRCIQKVTSTFQRLLFSQWIEIKDYKIRRRISLLSGFLFFFSLSTFIGAIVASSRKDALGLFLLSTGIGLFLVYLLSRTRYYRSAVVLTMIIPVLPPFFQMALSTGITDPLESIMWLAFPILVCALIASVRLAIVVSISYVFLILLIVTIFQVPIPILDSAIPFILMIGALAVAITRVRQREQSEAEHETEQRLIMEQRMLNRERFFRTLLDSFSTGVIVADPEYFLVKDTNTAMMDLLDKKRIDIVGEKVSDIITIPGLSLDESLFAGTSPNVFEGEIFSKNNTGTPVVVSFSELRSEDTTNIFITFVDISEKKKRNREKNIWNRNLLPAAGLRLLVKWRQE